MKPLTHKQADEADERVVALLAREPYPGEDPFSYAARMDKAEQALNVLHSQRPLDEFGSPQAAGFLERVLTAIGRAIHKTGGFC